MACKGSQSRGSQVELEPWTIKEEWTILYSPGGVQPEPNTLPYCIRLGEYSLSRIPSPTVSGLYVHRRS